MRHLLLALSAIAALALSMPARAQMGFDRPGGDYLNFPVRSGDPAVCASRCEREPRCAAWSFSYPRTAAIAAMCWLKNQVTSRVEDPCCISGVKGGELIEPLGGPVEYSIDRMGGDYRNFEVAPDPTGRPCADACQAEQRCRAWTYRRPGYEGPAAHCYLKERVTRPRHQPCCVSGVVR